MTPEQFQRWKERNRRIDMTAVKHRVGCEGEGYYFEKVKPSDSSVSKICISCHASALTSVND